VGPYFALENLGHNPYMRQVIERIGLTSVFLETGCKLAAIQAEIFRDLSPGHEFFQRFSFINSEDLPRFEAVLRRIESHGIEGLEAADREKLMTLPFKLVEAQHHMGLIDEDMKNRLLQARKAFASGLPGHLRGAVQFFDKASYNATSSIGDNILFGKADSHKAGGSAQIGRMVAAVVDELNLRDDIILAGLAYEIGTGGARFTAVQRQKIAVARCLVKRPDILIMHEALSSLELPAQDRVLTNIRNEMEGRSLILFESNENRRREFATILHMDQGRFIQHEDSKQSSGPGEVASGLQAANPASTTHTVGLDEMANMLMDIPIFAGIDRSKLKLLAFTSERVHFEPNQEVFHQGDPGDRAYVVIEGEVDVILESAAGQTIVATLGRNQLFGEMALLSKTPRTTTLRAKTPLLLLSINQDVFMRMVEENSDIAIAMMRVLAERLASTLRDYGKVMSREKNPTEGGNRQA
jgi:ABC-type sulfate/molybdate transport systems ATPase subunit